MHLLLYMACFRGIGMEVTLYQALFYNSVSRIMSLVAIVPGKLLQYTALVNGKPVDYSKGRHFVYVNGRGNRTAFPEITAANSYVIRTVKGKKVLTPTPFIKAESVALPGVKTAEPLKQNFAAQAPAIKAVPALKIDGKAFHYAIK